jgi:hypothetical protein
MSVLLCVCAAVSVAICGKGWLSILQTAQAQRPAEQIEINQIIRDYGSGKILAGFDCTTFEV